MLVSRLLTRMTCCSITVSILSACFFLVVEKTRVRQNNEAGEFLLVDGGGSIVVA